MTKLIAVHDESGKIRAAVRHGGNYKGPVPVAGPGSYLIETEIPESHAKHDLAGICASLRVDVRSGKLVEHK